MHVNRKKFKFTLIALIFISIAFFTSIIYYNNIFKADVTPSQNEADQILILVNINSPDSIELGQYYKQRRGVPADQIVNLTTTTEESITMTDYNSQIKEPIKTFLDSNNLKEKIHYIVPTYGVPVKIDTNYAVDSYLADVFDTMQTYVFYNNNTAAYNPYYKGYWDSYSTGLHSSPSHFLTGHTTYLVTRLDGASLKIAKGLVDKAIYAEKYTGPAENNQAYVYGQAYFNNARSVICGIIGQAGYNCKQASGYPAYDYSYDPKLIPKKELSTDLGGDNPLWLESPGNEYFDIWGNWRPGALPFHFQSYTAPTIRSTSGWRNSVVATLLAADVTATAGTVTEPLASGVPQPAAFFDYFLNGDGTEKHFNFAESMYMASQVIKWTNIVIGDPLYKLSDNPSTDNQPPKIENVVSSCTNNTANISWSNLTAADGSPEISYGSIEYGPTDAYGTTIWDETPLEYFGVSKKNYLSEHNFKIDNIDCASQYYFKISATDPEANNSSYSFAFNNSKFEFPPLIKVTSPNDGSFVSTSSVTISYTVDGNAKTKIFSNLLVGENLLEIVENNENYPALTSTVNVKIFYQLLPPSISITSYEDGSVVLDPSVAISYTVDGEAKTKTFSNLLVGENQLEILESNKEDASINSTAKIKIIYKQPLNLVPANFSSGWNMISFPDLSAAITDKALLPGTYKIRSYSGESNSYIKGEANDIILTPGTGYWIKIDNVNNIAGKRYALNQKSSIEISVTKGWNLLGNPYQSDFPLSNLIVRYKDGSTRPYVDVVARNEISGYAWSWESSSKEYFCITLNPDKYKTSAHKQTVINPYRGFWIIVKSDQISGMIFNK